MQGEKLGMYTSSIRPGTLPSYKNSVSRYMIPRLGNYKLSARKPHLIQRFIKELENYPGGLSAKTIKNMHDTLHRVLEKAVRVTITYSIYIHLYSDGFDEMYSADVGNRTAGRRSPCPALAGCADRAQAPVCSFHRCPSCQ